MMSIEVYWGNTGEHSECDHKHGVCIVPVCTCTPTPVEQHYVYYGITEPGSAWEWNPDCPVHQMETQMKSQTSFEWPCNKRKAHGPHEI